MANLVSPLSNLFEGWIGWIGLFVGSAGIAIILFTVIIRLILSPLQITQLRSARAMARLQPKIQEIRKKHGKDRQKVTEETMKLYKEHKVNPAMGCLPMLLQFPILIGLFWALNGLGESAHITVQALGKTKIAPWLAKTAPHAVRTCFPSGTTLNRLVTVTPKCWDTVNHLTVYSKANTLSPIVRLISKPIGGAGDWVHVKGGYVLSSNYSWLSNKYHANLWGASHVHHVYDLFHADFLWLNHGLGQPDPLYILPFLAGVTQWIQSRMMMQRTTDPQQQSMNTLMNFTPLIIIFFAFRYPSGLSLYWVTSTTIGILISMRITGWGTLPRLDRMILARGSADGSAPVGRAMTRAAADARRVTSNGKSEQDADIVLRSSNESEDATETSSTTPRTTKPRRRTNRQRGGRKT